MTKLTLWGPSGLLSPGLLLGAVTGWASMVGPTALGLERCAFTTSDTPPRRSSSPLALTQGRSWNGWATRQSPSRWTYGHLLPSLDDVLTDALEARFQSTPRDDLRGTCAESAELLPLTPAYNGQGSLRLQGSSVVEIAGRLLNHQSVIRQLLDVR